MEQLVLCHKKDMPQLEEYVRTITDTVFIYDDTTAPVKDPKNVLCIKSIPNLFAEGSTIGFVNTDNLHISEKLKEFENTIKKANEIFDVSNDNIKISKKGTLLPYKENPQETEKLKKFMDCQKLFDIAVVGAQSDNRNQYVNMLRQYGYKVDYISNMFGEERDKRIGQCTVLLNIHLNKNNIIYSWHVLLQHKIIFFLLQLLKNLSFLEKMYHHIQQHTLNQILILYFYELYIM
jgi:hypothetical protein